MRNIVTSDGHSLNQCDFCGFACGGIDYFYDVKCGICGDIHQKCRNIVCNEKNCKTDAHYVIDDVKYLDCRDCKRDKIIESVLDGTK